MAPYSIWGGGWWCNRVAYTMVQPNVAAKNAVELLQARPRNPWLKLPYRLRTALGAVR